MGNLKEYKNLFSLADLFWLYSKSNFNLFYNKSN